MNEIKIKMDREKTPNTEMILAIVYNNIGQLKNAIQKGADIHFNKNQAIGEAISANNLEIVNLLLERGARIEEAEKVSLTLSALHGAIDLIKLVMSKRELDQIALDKLLHTSCFYGHVELMKYLIKQGADVHSNNDVVMVSAVCSGSLYLVQKLVTDYGGSVEEALKSSKNDEEDIDIFNWCEKYIETKKLNAVLENDRTINNNKTQKKKI